MSGKFFTTTKGNQEPINIQASKRIPIGMKVFNKSQAHRGKFDGWLEREGVIVPSTKNPVIYLTPSLARNLEINGRVLLGEFADGKFALCNTHQSDKNGYAVDETTPNSVLKVAASKFVNKHGLVGDRYYFYPTHEVTDALVAIFDPRDREEMEV